MLLNLITRNCLLIVVLFTFALFTQLNAVGLRAPFNNTITNAIKEALFFGNSSMSNNTRDDCVWRKGNDKDACPDPDIRFILYTSEQPDVKQIVDLNQADWLRNSNWNPNHENIILIHGYAGGDDTLPIIVLRDAYLRNGSYNVFMVDWGKLCEPPCYPAAVHNTRAIGRCTAEFLSYLRNHGLPIEKTTCVGHSLGAHICGIMSNYLLFRMHRIIALDPARPLVRPGNNNRLDNGDANAVHVIHTNAGHYGEMGRVGHADFCVNGGRTQPFCEVTNNVDLCSHVWVICYMAESIHDGLARKAEPCTRRCPIGMLSGHRFGLPVKMGQFTPTTASGSYCISAKTAPFCPKNPGDIGDVRCCIKPDTLN